MTGTGPGIAGEIALESNKGIWLSDQRPTLLCVCFSLSLDIYIYVGHDNPEEMYQRLVLYFEFAQMPRNCI